MNILEEIQDNPSLLPTEKVILMRNTFISQQNQNTDEKIYISNIGDYLSDNFSKIDGFDYRWNSLITSNPLLFEDVDYIRVKDFITNEITQEEIAAYKRGELRELYATFENMLICNLAYYDRIMNFCTMIFLHYVRISEDSITSEYLDELPYLIEMTPTRIWCCVLSGLNSSEWELNYGWNTKVVSCEKQMLIENNWKLLYSNPIFGRFIEYSSLRANTSGFRQTLLSDKTSNKKLSQVCAKFTKSSTAISDGNLETLIDYVREQERINSKLYFSLFNCLKKLFNNDESLFAIYVFAEEFFIHTAKFSMKVKKSENGKITKDYLANSYECFIAEEFLYDSIRVQIEWAKYKLPPHFEYEKQILTSLLNEMLKGNYRNILAIKRMNEYGILSKITFAGVFDNIYISEELMVDNRCIKSSKICLSKANAAKYVVDRGYYIFGLTDDVYKFILYDDENVVINRQVLIDHYGNYCVQVIKHMFEVIALHNLSKNDIIDVVCSGILNPNKLNNENIRYTKLKSNNISAKNLMSLALDKQNKGGDRKKSYWKIIEN